MTIIDVSDKIVSKVKVTDVFIKFEKDGKQRKANIRTTCTRSERKIGMKHLNEFTYLKLNANELFDLSEKDLECIYEIAAECGKL